MNFLTELRRAILQRWGWLRTARRWVESAPAEALRPLRLGKRIGPPQGTFSLASEVCGGQAEGRIVHEAMPIPPAAEGSLSLVCQQLGLQPRHQLYPVFWARCPEMRLAGSTLVPVNDRKQAVEEAMFGEERKRDPGYHYAVLPRAVRLPGRWTSLIALYSDAFYHWMIEALPRLAMLPELPPDTGILVHENLLPFQEETLRLLGLEHRVRRTRERHLVVEDFYFLSPSADMGMQHPASIRFLRDAFLPQADQSVPAHRSLFLTRRNLRPGGRGVTNADELQALFDRRGWHTPDLDRLPLTAQIQLFAHAERICAVHGGALTNLVWCRPGCRLLELCSPNYPNGCYEILSARVGVDYRYQMCEGSPDGNVHVDMQGLEKALDALG